MVEVVDERALDGITIWSVRVTIDVISIDRQARRAVIYVLREVELDSKLLAILRHASLVGMLLIHVSNTLQQLVVVEHSTFGEARICVGSGSLGGKVVLERGSVSIGDGDTVPSHGEIAGIDAPAMASKLVEVLLETLLIPHEALVVGCEEFFGFVFDEWAGGTRASHFNSLTSSLN